MKAANIETSPRLQRVDNLLANGGEFTTLEIIAHCGVCAVNSIVSELRANGRDISCHRVGRAWYYRRADV